MVNTESSTIVGIPFYDGEGPDVLDAALRNVDICLNQMQIDAGIVIGINGPRINRGLQPLEWGVNKSDFNADIKFIRTPPGLVAAERTICRHAVSAGLRRTFLLDADVSPFPRAFLNMWDQGDKPIVGANYATYPPEVMRMLELGLTDAEYMLMEIFEADKHPLAREFTTKNRHKRRLKGSLLLIDAELGPVMFGQQGITSDSVMNSLISPDDRLLVQDAVFMHYPRIDLTDYIQARMRHMRAAHADRRLDQHSSQEVKYSVRDAEEIAAQIKAIGGDDAEKVASNFLLQTALRYEVVALGRQIILGKPVDFSEVAPQPYDRTVATFAGATAVIRSLIKDMADLDSLQGEVTKGKGITQTNLPRAPLYIAPLLNVPDQRRMILSYVGLDASARV